MKLSVCIPIYQTNVVELVHELIRQCEEAIVDFEICLIDDYSKHQIRLQNRVLKDYPKVIYKELLENVGRSAIRNQLAKLSSGDYCLFLDNNIYPNKGLILNYLSAIEGNKHLLICGGYEYQIHKKNRKGKQLRYRYGKQVEEIQIEHNNMKSPFLSGNFIVNKTVFKQIQFDESLLNYGYEDVLYAIHFQSYYGDIHYIYNPVFKIDLPTNEVFLQKTVSAMQNLAYLYHHQKLCVKDNIKLLLVFEELRKKKMEATFMAVTKNFLPLLMINLVSEKPSLKFFQIFKLYNFAQNIHELES